MAASLNVRSSNPACSSWAQPIFPFMEQDALYDAYAELMLTTEARHMFSIQNTPIETLQCPSDPGAGTDTARHGATHDRNNGILSNYLACMGSQACNTGNSTNMNGMFFYQSGISFRDVTDGTAHTVMMGEVLINPSLNREWRGRIWRSDHLGSMFSTRYTPNTSVLDRAITTGDGGSVPSYNYLTLQGPGAASLQNFSARSLHPGGAQVCMGDGAVRFVNENVDTDLWHNVGTRDGGEPKSFVD